ncbi:MAG: cytochrome c maturation protein CcmE [Cyclobacteriaceae bacterium]|nr:cytochrome c maturation protein CcmE [Cyclobacteriaceae bacterium HetDA_MAG_MS6]
MKKTHIFGLVVIAIAVAVIATTAGDASSFVSFNEAQKIASSSDSNKIHVVGTLKKNASGEVVGVQKSPDNLSFKFVMIDENNFEQEVFHPKPIPTDFVRSEQVVVVGGYQDGSFIAEKILLKCPSKYQEDQLNV